jgi:hypothetical protein
VEAPATLPVVAMLRWLTGVGGLGIIVVVKDEQFPANQAMNYVKRQPS